jgi:UDP-N-acetylglucosamine 1-carboxyvinyltransferase
VDRFDIVGPCRLAGTVAAARAKNAALPAMAASLLSDQEVILEDLPAVQDIRTMRTLLAHLGVEGREAPEGLVLRRVEEQCHDDARYELVKTMRASILVLGPLVARLGHARVSLPGGCAIGVRPIDQHLAGLAALGAEVALDHGYVTARANRLEGARFRFETPTVTGTENLMMAAALARGTTVLENCAREPEIDDLATLLRTMGAEIEGAGSPTVTIHGVERLAGATHRVIPDRIESGTFLIGAAVTGGDVTLTDARPEQLGTLLEILAANGCAVDVDRHSVRVRREGSLRARDVATAPYPGFPTDLQAQYLALMTQAEGMSRIHETVFENRFQHVPELARMGARIEVDQGEAIVSGPAQLTGAHVMATDLRASACLVLAALVADGETRIHRIYHLDRGYEAMEEKLRALGADVTRAGE